jgi:hypothetical protein
MHIYFSPVKTQITQQLFFFWLKNTKKSDNHLNPPTTNSITACRQLSNSIDSNLQQLNPPIIRPHIPDQQCGGSHRARAAQRVVCLLPAAGLVQRTHMAVSPPGYDSTWGRAARHILAAHSARVRPGLNDGGGWTKCKKLNMWQVDIVLFILMKKDY